jgi:hypothetical protein
MEAKGEIAILGGLSTCCYRGSGRRGSFLRFEREAISIDHHHDHQHNQRLLSVTLLLPPKLNSTLLLLFFVAVVSSTAIRFDSFRCHNQQLPICVC